MIGDEYWAWQCQEPSGEWGLIGVTVGGQHAPLIVRHRDLVEAENVRTLAEKHSLETGQPLRLAHFTLAEVIT